MPNAVTQLVPRTRSGRGLPILAVCTWRKDGAGRLLIPDCQKSMVTEMLTGKHVVISRGPWPAKKIEDAIELMFDDDSEAPFALQLSVEQCSQMLPDSYMLKKFSVTLWTREGLVGSLPGKYRRASQIPLLQPWSRTKVKIVVTVSKDG